ncbi:MAG: hypothetical protein M1429_03690 [Patescibacteria group bacterium]|nr:hypothetical protein [Patescibacteria group bacterium]
MQPALFMPIGDRDWQADDSCLKLNFMEVLLPKLASLGWTIGVDFKSDQISVDDWHGKCAERILQKGGRLVWHPGNFKIAFGIGKSGELTDLLRQTGEDALFFQERYPLEALVIHPDAVQYSEPASYYAGLERYNMRVTANKVLQAIKNHLRPLGELNVLCGGILHIENVHNCLFSENQTNLPTYEAMQLGYLELPWITKEAGIKTVMDSEHFFGARNFYLRQEEFVGLYPSFPVSEIYWTKDQRKLANLAGYLIKKNYPSIGVRNITYQEYLNLLKPRLFHIGGARRLVSEDGQVAAHIETDTNDLIQRQTLLLELDYIVRNNCIGAVVEVDSHPSWSPRSADDFIAKMRECLTTVDALEKLQDGIWQIDPNAEI